MTVRRRSSRAPLRKIGACCASCDARELEPEASNAQNHGQHRTSEPEPRTPNGPKPGTRTWNAGTSPKPGTPNPEPRTVACQSPQNLSPQTALQLPHRVRLIGQSELRAADDRVHAGVGDVIQHVGRVDPPVEREPTVPRERTGRCRRQRERAPDPDRVAAGVAPLTGGRRGVCGRIRVQPPGGATLDAPVMPARIVPVDARSRNRCQVTASAAGRCRWSAGS